MSSNVPNRNLLDGQNHLYGLNGDGLSPGHSLHVTGNNTTVSISVHNPDNVDLQIEMTRFGSNIWVPIGEVITDSRIYYAVWMNDYLYRIRQIAAAATAVTVFVRNNHDYSIRESNGGFLTAMSGTSVGGVVSVTGTAVSGTATNPVINLPADDTAKRLRINAQFPLAQSTNEDDVLAYIANAANAAALEDVQQLLITSDAYVDVYALLYEGGVLTPVKIERVLRPLSGDILAGDLPDQTQFYDGDYILFNDIDFKLVAGQWVEQSGGADTGGSVTPLASIPTTLLGVSTTEAVTPAGLEARLATITSSGGDFAELVDVDASVGNLPVHLTALTVAVTYEPSDRRDVYTRPDTAAAFTLDSSSTDEIGPTTYSLNAAVAYSTQTVVPTPTELTAAGVPSDAVVNSWFRKQLSDDRREWFQLDGAAWVFRYAIDPVVDSAPTKFYLDADATIPTTAFANGKSIVVFGNSAAGEFTITLPEGITDRAARFTNTGENRIIVRVGTANNEGIKPNGGVPVDPVDGAMGINGAGQLEIFAPPAGNTEFTGAAWFESNAASDDGSGSTPTSTNPPPVDVQGEAFNSDELIALVDAVPAASYTFGATLTAFNMAEFQGATSIVFNWGFAADGTTPTWHYQG